MEYAHAYTATLARYEVDPGAVRVHAPPPWLTREDLLSIRRAADLPAGRMSLFTPGLAARFARAYLRSPWVRRAVAARARYPRRVDVLLELRKPLAGVVSDGGGIVLVDEEGVRLPGRRRRPPAGLGRPFFLLAGVAGPPPAAGEVWSRAVREGASVAADLSGLPPRLLASARIVAIDVSNVGGAADRAAPEIVLDTAAGARIEWGRSRLSPLGLLEPPLARKLLLLKRALLLYPGLGGLRRVKLQFDELYVEEEGDPDHVRGG